MSPADSRHNSAVRRRRRANPLLFPLHGILKIFKSLASSLRVDMLPSDDPIEEDSVDNLTEKENMIRINNMLHSRQRLRLEAVQEEIGWTLRQCTSLRASLIARIVGQIKKWYRAGEEVNVVEVDEGELKKLTITFKDTLGNTCKGNTDIRIIKRALPEGVAIGKAYKKRVFEEAWFRLERLDIFSNVHMLIDQSSGDLSCDIELEEHPQIWSDVQTTWNPGSATLQFGRRNIKGLNRTLEGEITLSNLFGPGDNIDFNFDYTHPYIDGIDDPRNRKFQASCFRTRNASAVFWGGPTVHAPFISVDKRGMKATITQDYTRQSNFTYGLVLEDVKTGDEEGNIALRGHRVSSDGQLRGDGPPTTLSRTGNDRLVFLEANLTRDTRKFVNGAIVGARDVFQVDQAAGIGSKLAYFNRFKLSATRFIPLRKVMEGKGNPTPPTLVLRGLYANCIGDLPNHEAFLIGGPNSVRGYSYGVIGASRSKLEVAAEVRVPVKKSFVYAFVEHGNDLGSSASVVGNPTKSYLRKGHGTSYGVGVEYGQVRAEYAVDHNANRGAFLFHFGERFSFQL